MIQLIFVLGGNHNAMESEATFLTGGTWWLLFGYGTAGQFILIQHRLTIMFVSPVGMIR